MEAVLEFDNVTFGYMNGGKRVDILKNASVSFEKGVALRPVVCSKIADDGSAREPLIKYPTPFVNKTLR
ncbi:MAG: hypothetical protein WC834_03385 [Eubacteriales bacterium]